MRLDERTAFLLAQLGSYSAQRFSERLAPLGMQPAQFGLLAHLTEAEGATQSELAAALGIHRNVMVALLDALESAGLVERRRHPGDRRANAVHLTDAALELLPRATAEADALEAELLGSLGDDERAALIASLQRVVSANDVPAGVHPGLQR